MAISGQLLTQPIVSLQLPANPSFKNILRDWRCVNQHLKIGLCPAQYLGMDALLPLRTGQVTILFMLIMANGNLMIQAHRRKMIDYGNT